MIQLTNLGFRLTKLVKPAAIALFPVVLVTLISCSSTSTPRIQTTSTSTYVPGVPGGTTVETRTLSAVVTEIDAPNRTVVMLTKDGKKTRVKCGPDVINFDQIRVDDHLIVTMTEQIVVALAGAAEADGEEGVTAVALAPKGAKPGGVIANATKLTATLIAIDLDNYQVTLQFPDGSTKTVTVRDDVDLARQKVGETVVIRITEVLALNVVQPDQKH